MRCTAVIRNGLQLLSAVMFTSLVTAGDPGVPKDPGTLLEIVPFGNQQLVALYRVQGLSRKGAAWFKDNSGDWLPVRRPALFSDLVWPASILASSGDSTSAWICVAVDPQLNAGSTNRILEITGDGSLNQHPAIPGVGDGRNGVSRLASSSTLGLFAVRRRYCDSIEECQYGTWSGPATIAHYSGESWRDIELDIDGLPPTDLFAGDSRVTICRAAIHSDGVVVYWRTAATLDELRRSEVHRCEIEAKCEALTFASSTGRVLGALTHTESGIDVTLIDVLSGRQAPVELDQEMAIEDAAVSEGGKCAIVASERITRTKVTALMVDGFLDEREQTFRIIAQEKKNEDFCMLDFAKVTFNNEQAVAFWHWAVVGI